MQELKAILDKIQRPRNKDELLPAWWVKDNILSFVDQALAKLKEEPKPTEFIKECRELCKRGATAGQWEYDTKLGEACKIIEQLQAEIKSQDKHIELLNQCDDSSTEVIGEMDVEIVQLQAENKKLIEGQQARKEAGS